MRITTILSLVGVLSAGSAAAVVNNDVLANTSTAASHTAIDIGANVHSATQVFSDTLTATQLMFQIDSSGVVTLDTAGDALTIVSVTTNPGWTVVDSEARGSADVAVTFQSGDELVAFTANRANDAVTTAIGSNSADSADGNSSNGTGNGSSNGTGTDGTDGANGVDDANGTGNDDTNSDDKCSGGLVTVCVDADNDVQVNDD